MSKKQKQNEMTFSQIVEKSRVDSAHSAWDRAKNVSQMRHCENNRGKYKSAKRLSQLKIKAIRLALSLAPEKMQVSIDSDYQVGLLSIRWSGAGRLHLPSRTNLSR